MNSLRGSHRVPGDDARAHALDVTVALSITYVATAAPLARARLGVAVRV